MVETATIFRLREIEFSFRTGRKDVPVLRGVSIDVRRGETLGILGLGGSGKTTLLKVMAGLLRPKRGERISETEKLGMTFQRSGLFDSLTVRENLLFPMREATQLLESEQQARATEALKDVGLEGQDALFPHELSGGMQKRLGIARALSLRPELILYDDPTAGLDPVTSRKIIELIFEMKRKHHMTVVIVTSDPPRAYESCDRIAFLDHGKIVSVDDVDSFRLSRDERVEQFLHPEREGA